MATATPPVSPPTNAGTPHAPCPIRERPRTLQPQRPPTRQRCSSGKPVEQASARLAQPRLPSSEPFENPQSSGLAFLRRYCKRCPRSGLGDMGQERS
jgi:hypothetical protein